VNSLSHVVLKNGIFGIIYKTEIKLSSFNPICHFDIETFKEAVLTLKDSHKKPHSRFFNI